MSLQNKYGLHARPATLFAEIANQFTAHIRVAKDEMVVSGKSIFGIMTLGAERGTALTIRAWGEDAARAVEALRKLIDSKFGEE